MSKVQRFIIAVAAVYFGEPVLMRLLGKMPSLQHKLALLLIVLAVGRILPKQFFIGAAVVCTLFLAGLIHFAPNAAALYPLTMGVYALAWSALLAVVVEVWKER